MSKKQSKHQDNPGLKFATDANFQTIYTNFVQTNYTPFDFQFLVGQNVVENNEWIVNHRVRLIMSPVEAKSIVGILADSIKGYEELYGTIVLPDLAGAAKKAADKKDS